MMSYEIEVKITKKGWLMPYYTTVTYDNIIHVKHTWTLWGAKRWVDEVVKIIKDRKNNPDKDVIASYKQSLEEEE